MKILIINWRSITDPLKGGAEVVTFEHSKRWVRDHNAEVTWLCAKYDQKKDFEILEGVKFEYIGKELKRDSVFNLIITFPIFYYLVYINYCDKFRSKIDVIIDQVHGIPFLTPLYAKEKIVLFIHEIAGNIWDKMFPFPVNKLGMLIERIFLKFYRNHKIITVSNSTKDELLKLSSFKNVVIIKNGVNTPTIDEPKIKNKDFTLVFLNRMVKMKGPERAIEIFKKTKELIPTSKMIMIGKGDENYVKELNKKIKELNLAEDIEIIGFVKEEEKLNYLQKAHVLINTSFKEGWGLVNIEANTQGTPAVSFDVEGCRDSIVDGVNGYVSKNEDEFVKNILKIQEKDLSNSSLEYSKNFNWDIKAEEFYQELK